MQEKNENEKQKCVEATWVRTNFFTNWFFIHINIFYGLQALSLAESTWNL